MRTGGKPIPGTKKKKLYKAALLTSLFQLFNVPMLALFEIIFAFPWFWIPMAWVGWTLAEFIFSYYIED